MSSDKANIKVMVPVETRSLKRGTSLSVRELLDTPGVDSALAKRIQEADRDGSGGISVQEVLEVFRSEQVAVSERRMMRR